MKTATITEAKMRLSSLIDLVKAGEQVTILDRGIPVARLTSVHDAADSAGRLRRLERAGIVRAATGVPPLDLVATPPPSIPLGASAVDALLEERRSGR